MKRYAPLIPLFMLCSFGILGIFIGTACRQVPQGTPTPEPAPAPVASAVVEPVDCGNGVYYFPATGNAYIAALAKFYENGNGGRHCDMQGFTEQVDVYNRGRYTEITGFILHCHDLAIDAQSLTKE